VPGSPIRTPSDHSSVDSSPRTIAASHVLHRLLMPRHPPCALTHLTTTRCSHPLCNTQHTTTPRQPGHHHHDPPTRGHSVRRPSPGAAPRSTHPRVSPQDPTACQAPTTTPGDGKTQTLGSAQSRSTQPHPQPTPANTKDRAADPGAESSERRTPQPQPPAARGRPHRPAGLLRKEVIQPHLPVRLPCYDFVPIASPTFDDSPRQTG
jgi:hypothetical protein